MQPIAAGYDVDSEKFPRVSDWMKRVKNETQPFFDQAHQIILRMRESVSQKEKSKL